jgi:hypothetical protein
MHVKLILPVISIYKNNGGRMGSAGCATSILVLLSDILLSSSMKSNPVYRQAGPLSVLSDSVAIPTE